jgi:hypothetical protein
MNLHWSVAEVISSDESRRLTQAGVEFHSAAFQLLSYRVEATHLLHPGETCCNFNCLFREFL